MKENAKVSAIQMASGPQVSANLSTAEKLIRNALENKAELIVLPENFACMPRHDSDIAQVAETAGEGPIQDFLKNQAQTHKIWIVGGTIPIKSETTNKIRASSLVFSDSGEQVGRYDKVHLFDVNLEENDEKYTESKMIEPGNKVVVVDTPIAKIGIAICYDLRFPEVFRKMHDQGVELIVLPSAFTAITGKAHWEILVRARAIENLCYVVAAAQGGYHLGSRETHGHSMIVGPWGAIMNALARGQGNIEAIIDRARFNSVRQNFPSIEHRRFMIE